MAAFANDTWMVSNLRVIDGRLGARWRRPLREDRIVAELLPMLPWMAGLIAVAAALSLAMLWVAPLLWALSTSLRPEYETILPTLHLLPREWTVAAYTKTLAAGNVPRWLFNSALVALLVTVVTMAISLMAAFAFSQLRFRGRDLLFGVSMLALLLQTALVS